MDDFILFFCLGNGLVDLACFCFSAACLGLDVLANVDGRPTPSRVEQFRSCFLMFFNVFWSF